MLFAVEEFLKKILELSNYKVVLCSVSFTKEKKDVKYAE